MIITPIKPILVVIFSILDRKPRSRYTRFIEYSTGKIVKYDMQDKVHVLQFKEYKYDVFRNGQKIFNR